MWNFQISVYLYDVHGVLDDALSGELLRNLKRGRASTVCDSASSDQTLHLCLEYCQPTVEMSLLNH